MINLSPQRSMRQKRGAEKFEASKHKCKLFQISNLVSKLIFKKGDADGVIPTRFSAR
jgi:hypothetical protein